MNTTTPKQTGYVYPQAAFINPSGKVAFPCDYSDVLAESASLLSGFLGYHADALSLDQVGALSGTLSKLKPFIKP